jgi:hypothetical protein
MFHIKVVEKIETHSLCSITLSRKSCHLQDNVAKYCRDRQAMNDILHAAYLRLYTHPEYVILFAFQRQQVAWTHLNVMLIHTLPVL